MHAHICYLSLLKSLIVSHKTTAECRAAGGRFCDARAREQQLQPICYPLLSPLSQNAMHRVADCSGSLQTLCIVPQAGGFVTDGRVNGSLNLSRALGDMEYKQSSDLQAAEQIVTAVPEVQML